MGDVGDTVSSNVPRIPNTELSKLLVFRVYKRRWFVLLVLCLLNCSNATLWLTFAPVADQSAQYLKVTLEEINWLSLVYMVVAIPLSFGTTWMLDTLGLRITMVLGSWLNMFGAVVRACGMPLRLNHTVLYPVVMLGQTLGALAQPLIIFTPTKLAALWFPDHQRATANMIASMSNPLGVLLANIISPMIAETSAQIPTLLIAYAIPACIICFLATVGIRSSAPPTPPSASAETSSSEPFIEGLKLMLHRDPEPEPPSKQTVARKNSLLPGRILSSTRLTRENYPADSRLGEGGEEELLKNKAYLVLLLCFGSGMAVFTCFSTLLEQILCVQGYSNDFAGMCGALFIVFGIVGAGALGLYVDKTKKFIEVTKINMSFTALSCIAFSVVSLMRQQKAAVAAVCSLFGFFGFSIYPVAMELSVESSYPVGEATSAGLIFVSGQVQSVLYIILLQALTKPLADSPLSTCGNTVLSWRVPLLVMAGLCSLFTCCFVIFFHTRYRRLEAEEQATYGTKRSGCSTTTEHAPSVET